MIRTQLCPVGELEDKRWWGRDLAVLLGVGILSYWAMVSWLDVKRDETTTLMAKKERWEQELNSKQPQLEQFKNLKAEMELLNKKIYALKKITTSKVDKVKPLVALDQLQTLWIEGVWYESIDYAADGSLVVKGSANDSLLIGEYMLGLRETVNPETINDDVRTQLGFNKVSIKTAKYVESADDLFRDITVRMTFDVRAMHAEKKLQAQAPIAEAPRGRSDFQF